MDSDDDLLTLKEVCQRLDVPYNFLRGYADRPELRQFVGARAKKGSKGVGYPVESLSTFQNIVDAVRANRLTLGTLPAHLATLFIQPIASLRTLENDAPQQVTDALLRRLVALIAEWAQFSAGPDAFISFAEAQRRTGVPYRDLKVWLADCPRYFKSRRLSLRDVTEAVETMKAQKRLES